MLALVNFSIDKDNYPRFGGFRAAEGGEGTTTSNDIALTEGSDNVFADLQVESPDEAQAKAKLAHLISTIITKRHLTQAQAAVILGIDQPKVSALMWGRLAGFSVDRLLRFLMALGRDIEITIKPKPRSRPHGRLDVAAG